MTIKTTVYYKDEIKIFYSYLKSVDIDISKLHREDGPAIESDFYPNEYYINGKLHRIDGPAIIFKDGINQWYYNGIHIKCSSLKEFQQKIKILIFT